MDITTEQRAFNTIKKMLVNPTVKVTMLLPEKVFVDFNFDRFIFLKHKDFQGYFFVEKIENYKNGKTPVKVYLNMVDPQTFTFVREGDVEQETNLMLLETGDYILLETGDNIILE
jgi:hypothetical protein